MDGQLSRNALIAFNCTIDFYREWDEYERGFGSLYGEHWLGLRKLHQLTQSGRWLLRVDLEAFDESTAYAEYDSFTVGDATSNYILNIGPYTGTAGDSLRYHNNMPFTTRDRDNDPHNNLQCAVFRQGGWWYRSCAFSNLNRLYLGSGNSVVKGITWRYWKNLESLKRSEIKIKRMH